MKCHLKIAVMLSIATLCAGCHADRSVSLIEPPPRNLLSMATTGSAKKLMDQKRIDLTEKCAMPDGTEIDVWVIKARIKDESQPAEPRGTVIVLHGLGDNKASYLRLGEKLSRIGFDVVLPDLRGHGYSSGQYVTYGAKEKYDIKAVMDELLDRGVVHEPIYAAGVSLGGAVAILYADVDPRCKGVLAVAPPKEPMSVMRSRLAFQPLMSEDEFNALVEEASQKADFDIAEASAIESAGRLAVPLLLIHGLIDLAIPLENSEALLNAAKGPKKLIVITPGPEQGVLLLTWDDYLADKIDMLARTGLKEPPATQPSS